MIRIAIVGGGAVASGLAREIGLARDAACEAGNGDGVALVQQWTRKTHRPSELAPADLYILAVSDGAVAELSRQLPFAQGSVVAHTAGCVPMTALSEKIEHRAVLYPLQSFTRGREIENFRATPFFVEGTTEHALSAVEQVARALSDNVRRMSSDQRARIHLAGAFANNFSNAMLSLGEKIALDAGVDFDCLRPIVAETFAKAVSMPSPRMAQTGAAQRGDRTIQARHLEILTIEHPELVPIYELMSEQIWNLSRND